MAYLTETSLAELDQCEKRFWLSQHRPDLATAPDPNVFIEGRLVGQVARGLVPNGVLVPESDREAAIVRTGSLIADGVSAIFEGAFEHEGVFVRVDLLMAGDDGWRMAEVKSSTKAKAHHLRDLATQVWVARGAGLDVAAATIRHVNSDFVYEGAGDYRGLLVDAELADRLAPLVESRGKIVRKAGVVAGGAEPSRQMGSHCSVPHDCPYRAHCEKLSPGPDYPVELLPGGAGKKTAKALRDLGHADLRYVPADALERADHRRIHAATRDGVPYRDAAGFADVISGWPMPRYYLDFETVAHAVPVWIGRRAFEAVPFQFSCHVRHADGQLEHREFLDLTGDDPARACAEALLAAVGDRGAIVTYHMATERACIQALARLCPDLSQPLRACADRLVDLLPLIQAHYYHPEMRGSYSIKQVLSAAVPQLSYKALPGVQNGLEAQTAYKEAVAEETSSDRREAIRRELLAYCQLDTLAMVELEDAMLRRGRGLVAGEA